MSFFEDASLVLIPSAQKTSKVYSVKPTDGTGDLTFTRSNDTATRVGPDGLIEKVRTNLLTYSQAFDNAAWINSASGTGVNPVVTANNATAPDGTMTADTIVFDAGAGTSSSDLSTIYQTLTLSGTIYAGSFYARVTSGTGQLIFRHALGGAYTKANLTTTWQRFSSAETFGGGTQYFEIGIRRDVSEPVNASVTVQMWGAQLETGDIATDYIATTSAAVSVGPVANVPRLDYLGSSCPRLLLEPQRTNGLTYSEQFDNAIYTKLRLTTSANTSASPDGYTNADSIFETADNNTHELYQRPSVTSAQPITFSCFVKANGRRRLQLQIFDSSTLFASALFDVISGEVIATSGTSKIENYGNGWYRCVITGTSPTTSSGYALIGLASDTYTNATVLDSYAGDVTKGVLLYGAQTEANASYATSYIPTLGAAVTRGADDCIKTGISSLVSTTGTLFIDFVWNGVSDTVADNQIFGQDPQYYGTTNISISNYGGNLYGRISDGLTLVANLNASIVLTAGVRYKVAFAFQNNDIVLYVNGTLRNSATSGTIPTTSSVYLNNNHPNNKSVNQALVFKTRLSNADLAALTA